MWNRLLKIVLWGFAAASVFIVVWGLNHEKNKTSAEYKDGIEQIDLDTINLEGSGVEVSFSDVILSKPEEQRKLIICRQKGEVSTELTDRIIDKLDFNFMKKTQTVHYAGEGYFVVDLDGLTQSSIVEDKEKRVVTIYIDHAKLETVDIDPEKIIIDDVNESLFARGDIELTLRDFNEIEKQLRDKMCEKFNTVDNGQQADAAALKSVKEIYEPVVKALDKRYTVDVRFKD